MTDQVKRGSVLASAGPRTFVEGIVGVYRYIYKVKLF